MTLEQLAAKINYSTGYLQQVFSGTAQPSRRVIELCLHALGEDLPKWEPFIAAAIAGGAAITDADLSLRSASTDSAQLQGHVGYNEGSPNGSDGREFGEAGQEDGEADSGISSSALEAQPEPPRPRKRVGRRLLVVACAVAVAALVVGLWGPWANKSGNSASPLTSTTAEDPSTDSTASVAAPSTTSMSSSAAGRTFTEIAYARNGAPTFGASGGSGRTGPKIPFDTKVQVVCKALNHTMTSDYPDGYWYRLAGEYEGLYAAANVFLNGDAPDAQQFTHFTDWKVPDC